MYLRMSWWKLAPPTLTRHEVTIETSKGKIVFTQAYGEIDAVKKMKK